MTTEIRTIRLYGKMGTKFGRTFKLAVASPAEAVRALSAQIPGFAKYLIQAKDNGLGFAVFVGKSNLGEENLHTTYDGDIRIAPITAGSKKGWFKVIGGAILYFAGAVADLYGYYGLGEFLRNMGTALMMGGVSQLLTPAPKVTSGEDPRNQTSYLFNGAVNTQAQGNPVPVCYGRMIVGSAVISGGIYTEDIHAYAHGSGPGVGPGGSLGQKINYWIEEAERLKELEG